MEQNTFTILKNIVSHKLDESIRYYSIINNQDCLAVIYNFCKSTVDDIISYPLLVEILKNEPELLMVNLEKTPEIKKYLCQEGNINFFNGIKLLLANALYAYSIEYLCKNKIFKRDANGNIILQ